MRKKILLIAFINIFSTLLMFSGTNVAFAKYTTGCCLYKVTANNIECYALDNSKNYTQATCNLDGVNKFRKEYFSMAPDNGITNITWDANAVCNLGNPSNCLLPANIPTGSVINNNVINPKAKTVETKNTTNSVAPATTKSNLTQKGIVPSETGYLMDNCIKDGNCSVCAILATFAYAINWMFKIGVLGAFLMVTRYGILMLTSAGNEKKVSEAKSGITGTLIGILVLFSGWTIVNTVLTSFITQEPSQSVSIFNDGKQWYQFCK